MNNPNTEFTGTISYDIANPHTQKKSKSFYHSIISPINSKNRLHKYILYFLLTIILILFIMLIFILYTFLNFQASIPSKTLSLEQVTEKQASIKKTKSAINRKMIKQSLLMASYRSKNRKMSSIEEIMKHEIIHLIYKNLPYYFQFRDIISESILLRGIDDVGLLYSWFPSERLKTKEIEMKLLYRASRDGDDLISLHEKCDNQASNIVLIKTKGSDIQDSYLVGGFTTVPITSTRKSQWVTTGLTYVFSLDSGKKFRVPKIFNTVIHGYDVLLSYSNSLMLSDQFLTNDKGVVLDSLEDDTSPKEEPFTGKSYFIEDVEIFSVYVNKEVGK